MTIALTGSTGFLGSRVLRSLIDRGEKVVALVRSDDGGARDRVMATLEAIGTPSATLDATKNLLSVVTADVSEVDLGLSGREYADLARDVRTVWHSAGYINLQGKPEKLHDVNVRGTKNVLRLASSARAAVKHVSTAFVAGDRRGALSEEELLPDHGFENAYELSKHEAERYIHSWAGSTNIPATIFRPGILITDRLASAKQPVHTILQLGILLRYASAKFRGRQDISEPFNVPRHLAESAQKQSFGMLRIPGIPDGHLNLVPVEQAVSMMVRGSAAEKRGEVQTYHVVHPVDVPTALLLRVLETVTPFSISIEPILGPDLSSVERLVHRQAAGFLPYLWHRRQMKVGRLHKIEPTWPPVDAGYLGRSLAQVTTTNSVDPVHQSASALPQ